MAKTESKRELAMTAAGFAALLAGKRPLAISLFAAGFKGLEDRWRENHPEFDGDWKERWALAEAFYEETHRDEVNRWLHIVGIPIIVGGTAGLLVAQPRSAAWWASFGAFSFGWALNFVGHGVFEKAAPAFADDPLAFVAGPVWDFKQLAGVGTGAAASPAAENAA